ncbi:dephospho-CoA kinase [Geminisphaera colitermitum]|uniref:dephospho-CoA kinase n=1 Tax=Geminisphaera colitermitum TaxID=1148786 RepID=UPI000158D4F7|nr:dephospho-CoA kinase [Geminisphaera colitermitum]
MTIGLTGGMGCGKSTAARMFEEAGLHRIDCDEIVRNDVLTAPAVIDAIRHRWGPDVINAATGTVDRPALAARVFAADSDPDANARADHDRLWLENLLHPRVRAIWKARVATAPADRWIVEVPLLFEKHLEKEFDFTVCVAASSALQLERLKERGLPLALAEQRISKQLPLAQKIDLADFVLFNDGTPDFLREQVLLLVKQQLGNHS